MENLLQVVLLGIIEGITELLPISSTGHLLIAEHWLGRRSDLFNVAIQAGAILAVVVIYRRRLWELAVHFSRTENRSYVYKLAAAAAITVAGGFVAKQAGLELPDTVAPIAWALILGGLAIFAIEAYTARKPASWFFFVHDSVVLIGIGALVTAQLGFRGMMNIPEGESDGVIYIPEGRDYRRLQLPFQVRIDKFAIDFYNTGMPSEYRSDLSLVQDGKVLVQKRITVNDPLRYEGVTFYQSNFGDAGSTVNFTLRDLTNEKFPRQAVETAVGRTLEDGMGIKLQVKELRQHNVVNMSEDPDHEKLTDIGPSLDLLLQSPASGNISYRVYLSYPHMLAFASTGSEEMI